MPSPRPSHDEGRCPRCGAGSLLRDHVAGLADTVEVIACESCRDYWFERNGVLLSPRFLAREEPG